MVIFGLFSFWGTFIFLLKGGNYFSTFTFLRIAAVPIFIFYNVLQIPVFIIETILPFVFMSLESTSFGVVLGRAWRAILFAIAELSAAMTRVSVFVS